MRIRPLFLMLVALTQGAAAAAQGVTNPYATGIRSDDATVIGFRDFATLPDIDGIAARMMLLVER